MVNDDASSPYDHSYTDAQITPKRPLAQRSRQRRNLCASGCHTPQANIDAREATQARALLRYLRLKIAAPQNFGASIQQSASAESPHPSNARISARGCRGESRPRQTGAARQRRWRERLLLAVNALVRRRSLRAAALHLSRHRRWCCNAADQRRPSHHYCGSLTPINDGNRSCARCADSAETSVRPAATLQSTLTPK